MSQSLVGAIAKQLDVRYFSGHVIHYALYLYDSHRSEPMESLDDVVYYLKATIHSLELISALFVVGAGIKVKTIFIQINQNEIRMGLTDDFEENNFKNQIFSSISKGPKISKYSLGSP
jgi:hypothetical protein